MANYSSGDIFGAGTMNSLFETEIDLFSLPSPGQFIPTFPDETTPTFPNEIAPTSPHEFIPIFSHEFIPAPIENFINDRSQIPLNTLHFAYPNETDDLMSQFDELQNMVNMQVTGNTSRQYQSITTTNHSKGVQNNTTRTLIGNRQRFTSLLEQLISNEVPYIDITETETKKHISSDRTPEINDGQLGHTTRPAASLDSPKIQDSFKELVERTVRDESTFNDCGSSLAMEPDYLSQDIIFSDNWSQSMDSESLSDTVTLRSPDSLFNFLNEEGNHLMNSQIDEINEAYENFLELNSSNTSTTIQEVVGFPEVASAVVPKETIIEDIRRDIKAVLLPELIEEASPQEVQVVQSPKRRPGRPRKNANTPQAPKVEKLTIITPEEEKSQNNILQERKAKLKLKSSNFSYDEPPSPTCSGTKRTKTVDDDYIPEEEELCVEVNRKDKKEAARKKNNIASKWSRDKKKKKRIEQERLHYRLLQENEELEDVRNRLEVALGMFSKRS